MITHHVGYRKLLIINSGLIQLCKGLSAEVREGERGRGGEAYYRTKKKVFTTSYIAVLIKMLFEFDRLFKVQKVVKS